MNGKDVAADTAEANKITAKATNTPPLTFVMLQLAIRPMISMNQKADCIKIGQKLHAGNC